MTNDMKDPRKPYKMKERSSVMEEINNSNKMTSIDGSFEPQSVTILV
jgi:hypothetical protein